MIRSSRTMGRQRVALLFAAVLSLGTVVPAVAHEPGAAHYIANEGVLVRHGDTGVIFDALFTDGLGTYVAPDAVTFAAMDAGEAPFDAVDAVFVSHVHADHLDARRMLAFLRARPQVLAFGPVALRAALVELDAGAAVLDRVVVFDVAPYAEPATHDHEALRIEVVAVPHSNPQRFAGLQNLVFRVVLDDELTVLHLGDADLDRDAFEVHREHFAARESHGAFPPYWFFSTEVGRAIVAELLNVRRTIGVHVPAQARQAATEFRVRLGGDAFVEPGETRRLPHDD